MERSGSRSGRWRVRIVCTTLGVTLVAGLISVVAPAKASAPVHEAYHEATTTYHESRSKQLKDSGYRPISLSVFGATSDPRYAAVWVQRPGPEFITFHGYTRTLVNRASLAYEKSGYRLSMLTAATDAAGTVYAGMFVQTTTVPMIGIDLTSEGVRDHLIAARSKGHSLRWFAAYGDRFAAISWADDSKTPWGFTGMDDPAGFDQIQNALTGVGLNPDLITQGSGATAGRVAAIWRDEVIGRSFLRSNLTALAYKHEAAVAAKHGFFPIRLQGGGAPGAVRYSVVFALDDTVRERQMRYTGAAPGALSLYDDYMTSLMQSNGIRAGALAIVKDGNLVMSRGYTWAEPSYPLTQPTSQFRIASCSKPITGIAMAQLDESPVADLAWDDKMQDIVGLATPWGVPPTDPRVADVTVDNLLSHTGGWNRGKDGNSFDPMDHDLPVSLAHGGGLPVSKSQIGSFMATQPLDHSPGSTYAYSNFGFSLAGRIIEAKAGLGSYENVVKQKIFAPLGVTRPAIGATSRSGRAADEVLYHPTSPGVERSVLQSPQPWVARQYGGFNVENLDSAGGWRLAAPDFAHVLAAFDAPDNPLFSDDSMEAVMWGKPLPWLPGVRRGWFGGTLKDANGIDRPAYTHSGWLEGTSCLVLRRDDNLSWVLLLNGDMHLGWSHADELNAIANNMPYWPSENLFPAMGID